MPSPLIDNSATKLIRRPDGSEMLQLRQARLNVVKGPDRGLELLIERPRITVGSGADCELTLNDPAVSRRHLELRATEAGYQVRDLGSTNGTTVGDVRIERALITRPATLRLGSTNLRIAPTEQVVEIPLSQRGSFGGLLGQSQAMRQVFAVLERVAPESATVLIEGGSGTGKELAARGIHDASPRATGPYVVVDCGAIPANLIESELFGHERGAFTGAEQARTGALEEADGGTVFLDELGELPLELQPRLLRFLEQQQVKPLGAVQHRQVDVRVVAATNRNLADEVSAGRFREDLFYRLAVVRVELPPLRDRPEDVLLLAHHFAEQLARDARAIITDEIRGVLCAHSWPGNARELRNVVERLALMPEQAAAALRQRVDGDGDRPGGLPGIGELAKLPFHQARGRWQDLFERSYLSIQLDRAAGVVSHAAEKSGLPRQTFHRLLRKHGLKNAK